MLSGRALALALLAWSLVKVRFARMLGERTGLALFHDNYDADRLPPVTPEERRALASFSRCIACGRCDLGEAERMAASRGAYPGLMAVVLASSRSMPDFDAAARALEHVPEAVLAEKEGICPTGVPFRELARFVRAKAALTMIVGVFAGGCGGPAAKPSRPPATEAPAAGAGLAPASEDGDGERGGASYYSDRLAGRPTASGEPYDPRALTAAHRTLPFGTMVDVIRPDGRRVRVRINDRGPHIRGRIIDLSRRAAEAIGLVREGVAEVTVVIAAMPARASR